MSFDADKHDVGLADRGKVVDELRPHLKVAFVARDAQAPRLHRAQMRPACEQQHVGAGACEPRADVTADRAGAGDDEVHDACGAKVCATMRR